MSKTILEPKISDEYYDIVPRHTKEERQFLKESLMLDGQHQKIEVNESGVILDGHERYEILQELGMKPKLRIKYFKNKEDELRYVVITNIARRQLLPFQKVEIFYSFYKKEKQLAIERKFGTFDKRKALGRASEIIGKRIGLGEQIVRRAVFFIEHGDPVIKDKLRSGLISLNMAMKQYQSNPKEKQSRSTLNCHTCLKCNGVLKPASETKCHVHKKICCTSCEWGR